MYDSLHPLATATAGVCTENRKKSLWLNVYSLKSCTW